MGVDMHDLLSLGAAEHLFVALLEATLADVVAALVVVVAVQVGLVHLAHIAQHLRCDRAVVDAQGALRDVEAFEAEHLVLEFGVFLLRYLLHEDRGRVGRIFPCFLYALVEIVEGDVEALAKVGGVEVLHHARDDHEVVDGLVVYEELTVAVVDEAAGRVLCHVAQRLQLGLLLVFGIEELQHG